MRIAVLGPLTVDGESRSLAPRERAVLATLVVRRDEVVSPEVLAGVLWGEDIPASWTKVVQGCVVRLRKLLGGGAIETRSRGYTLAIATEDIDACRFERLVTRARELLTLGEPDRASYLTNEALNLWRGRALSELDDWDQGRIEGERLNELRLDAEEVRLDAMLKAGRYSQVLADALARTAEQPLREHRWTLLALAQYQAGRQGDALRTLRQARDVLVHELGVDPGPELEALEQAILRHEPTLVSAQLPNPSPVCPYMGLVPYDVDDADFYFGRDAETSDCIGRLTEHRVLAVVGPSGSGKSSLVRAGVAAALQRSGQRVVIINPGIHPMDALSVLTSSDAGSVLIVDQCEEVVTLCRDHEERKRFLDALVTRASAGMLVIALRADRLGELVEYPEFARLVERGLYLLKGMDDEGLRATIEQPARQAGLLLEPGLVDLLIRDVAGEPGSLPLLSHALRQTWERREANTMSVAAYQASGGIRGAVAQTAEQVYAVASPGQRTVLRDLMRRLVTPGPDGEPERSRLPRRAISADAEHDQVIELLVDARLVTSDEDVVELAHEALARAWPRLRGWLDDDIEGQRIWRHLATSAETWDSMGRPDSEVYRGVRLAVAGEWLDRTTPHLSSVQADFIAAGEGLADAERRKAEQETLRQVRVNRRLRALVAGVVVLAIAAGAGGLTAQRQAQRAVAAADAARSQELSASAIGVMDEDPTLAKLLAVASATMAEPTRQSIAALHEAWAADRVVSRYGATFELGLIWSDLNPNGDRIVVSGSLPSDGSGWVFEVVDPVSDELKWSLDLAQDPRQASAFVGSPFFSADGAQVVAGVFWDPHNSRRIPVPFDGVDEPIPTLLGAHLWDSTTGELLDRFDLGRCGGLVSGMSSTHLLVRTLYGSDDVVNGCLWSEGQLGIELVDRRTRDRRVLASNTDTWWGWGAALSDNGRYVAYDDGASGELVVANVETNEVVLRRDGHAVRDLNADGSLLLIGDSPIEVWDVSTGGVIASFDGHGGTSLFARFGPTGHTVYSTGADGALREWDARTGRELFAYPGVGNGRPSFSNDGLVVVAQPDRDLVTLLDLEERGELGAIETCQGLAAADGLRIVNGIAVFQVTCSGDTSATTYVVDVTTLGVLHTVPGQQPQALDVSLDGTRYVSQESLGTKQGPVVVRDINTGERLVELDMPCTFGVRAPEQSIQCPGPLDETAGIWTSRLRFSPDGTMIAAAVQGGLAAWDGVSGSLLFAQGTTNEQIAVADLVFSPDSKQLVTTYDGWAIRAFSTETWEVTTDEALSVDGGYHVGLIGYASGNSALLATGAFQANTAGTLHWLDPATLLSTRTNVNVHEGTTTAAALNPDETRVATASSDGSVRIWEVATGDLVHEVPFGGVEIRGVAFVNDHHVAVTPRGGGLLIATTDPQELLSLVRSSLTRGFTLPECSRFNFGNDCPTLAELRGSDLGISDPLAGTFTVSWTPEDLAAEMLTDVENFARAGLDPEAVEGIRGLAEHLAGTYTLTFVDGRFDIFRDDLAEAFCTGTYSFRGNRAWLSSERGLCTQIKFFDASFALEDGQLRFDRTDFRGSWPNWMVFATRPLSEVT